MDYGRLPSPPKFGRGSLCLEISTRAIARFVAFLLPLPMLAWPISSACQSGTPPTQSSGSTSRDLKDLSLEDLGNIEVTTVSKAPERAMDTPAAVYVITQEDIQRSGALTIPEALRLAPGVEVARIDSHTWSVGIRGFGSNLTRNVLVLIDGRTVYSTLLAGTYWEVQNLVMDDIDRIEVIRGPGGTIWGPNALNGVINIITKSSRDTHGVMVTAESGNLESGSLDAHYGGTNSRGLDYRAYELGFYRRPQYHPDGVDFDRWKAIQGGFRVDSAENKRDRFTLQGDIYDEGAGTSVSVANYSMPYSETLYGTERLSGGNILGRWKRVYEDGKDFEFQAFYDRTNRHQPNFVDLRDTYDLDFLDRFRLPGRQQISWGLGARFSRGDNPIVVPGLTFTPGIRTDRLLTAFFQDEMAVIGDRLTFTFGTKFLETNFTGLKLEPTGRMMWTPNKSQSVWAAFTHAIRTPSDAEENFTLLGYTGATLNGLPVFARFDPNPNFRSEELNGYEAGYRLLLRKTLYFDVAAFYNHYGHLFSEDVTGPAFIETSPAPTHVLIPADFGNGLLGTTKGIEIAPEWRPRTPWRLRASYSYLQMDVKRAPGSLDVGTAPVVNGSSPKHELSLQSDVDFAKAFSIDLTYRYVSILPEIAPGQIIPAYSTADARFDWQISRQFKLSAIGRNLFQHYHYEYAGADPGPSIGILRGVYGQITWTP
jgi:iron complex outermembrane receptor protein